MTFEFIQAGAMRGRSPGALAGGLVRNARGLGSAGRIIQRYRPHVVLATGGFVCVPVVLAARLLGVPSVIYLPDLRPGWAVRFLARIATAVAVSFDEVVPHITSRRVEVTGYPVRPDFASWTRESAKRRFALPPDELMVLVLGGSQGARRINDAIAGNAARILQDAAVIHSTGPSHFDSISNRLESLPNPLRGRYKVYPYLTTELAPAVVASDVVVSRAGASVLGEIPAAGTVGVLVPYSHAGAHQYLNAEFLSRNGAAVVVDEKTAESGGLTPVVLDLLAQPNRRAAMSAASRRLARPDAARQIFALMCDVAGNRKREARGGRFA